MAVITSNDQNFQTLLAQHPKAIVKFYAGWCGTCRLIAPKYRRLSDDERFADIAFLDVNAEESPEARKAAQVNNLPTFAIFHNGQLVESVATGKEEGIVALLEKLKNL